MKTEVLLPEEGVLDAKEQNRQILPWGKGNKGHSRTGPSNTFSTGDSVGVEGKLWYQFAGFWCLLCYLLGK